MFFIISGNILPDFFTTVKQFSLTTLCQCHRQGVVDECHVHCHCNRSDNAYSHLQDIEEKGVIRNDKKLFKLYRQVFIEQELDVSLYFKGLSQERVPPLLGDFNFLRNLEYLANCSFRVLSEPIIANQIK